MGLNWHFPRHDLTERFLSTFGSGVSNTLTLFAPRRMGKTEFVLYDLIPTAHDHGYLCIYVSFWENPKNPAQCLQVGLDRATSGLNWFQRKWRRLGTLEDLKISGEVGPITVRGSAGASFHSSTQSSDGFPELRDRFEKLLHGKTQVLLCLDEVQHLATDTRFEPLVSFLRTLIDEHREKLFVVYTGSSRDGLQRLFSRRKAPLFRSSSQIDLPPLGSEFVRHMTETFELATQRKIDFTSALWSFHELKRVPKDFRAVIEHMVLSGETDITEATREYAEQIDDEAQYLQQWRRLKPIDQAVLAWIASDQSGPYTDDAKAYIATWLGCETEDVRPHMIQNAINRLRGEFIAKLDHGLWDFEDQNLREWVRILIQLDRPPEA